MFNSEMNDLLGILHSYTDIHSSLNFQFIFLFIYHFSSLYNLNTPIDVHLRNLSSTITMWNKANIKWSAIGFTSRAVL